MERVAHQKTRDELDQVKKIAAIKMGTSPSAAGTPGGRSGFKTLAISTRDVPGGAKGDSILKQALDKVQGEKEQVESELARARQEIQLLKMRQ